MIVPTRQVEVNLLEGLACIIHEHCCHRGFTVATSLLKVLDMGDRMGEVASAKETGGRLRRAAPRIEEARQLYTSALLDNKEQAIATLGRTDYEYYLGRFRESLMAHGAVLKKEPRDAKRDSKREKNHDIEHTMRVIKEALSDLKEHEPVSR